MTDVLRKRLKKVKKNQKKLEKDQGKVGGEANINQDDHSDLKIDPNDLFDIDEDRRKT